jgi:hypothetical protein
MFGSELREWGDWERNEERPGDTDKVSAEKKGGEGWMVTS